MSKKYEMTEETKNFFGHVLHRIRALRNFGDVKKGDLGGWIECFQNLSHKGNCWIYQNAMVFGEEARVYNNAKVFDNAMVYDNAEIYDNVQVRGSAIVCGSARVYDNARICNNALVSGHAEVTDCVRIADNTCVFDYAIIANSATVCGNSVIFGNAEIIANMYIRNGRWNVSPLFIQGKNFSFNVMNCNEVRWGGEIHTFKEWRNKYKELVADTKEFVGYFNLACRTCGHEDCVIIGEEG